MLIIHPTKSLAARMGIEIDNRGPISTAARLGAWYATDVRISNEQLILCISEHARLPVMLKAAPYKTFPARFPLALSDVLKSLGVKETVIANELIHFKDLRILPTTNRSILGTLAQNTKDLKSFGNEASRPSALELSLWLADGVCMPLEEKIPSVAAKNLLSAPILRLVNNT